MAKPEEKKVAPPKTPNATGGKKVSLPSGNDDISDDPIAQAIQQRMKAGGLTSVVTKTPVVNKIKAPAEKATEVKTDTKQQVAKPAEKKPEAAKEEVKKPAVVKKDAEPAAATTTDKKPASSIPKINASKPTTTAKPAEEKKEPVKPIVPAKTTTAAKEGEAKKTEPKAVSGQSAPKTLKGKKKNEEEVSATVPVEESKEVSIPDDEPVSAQIQNDEKLLLEDETTPSFQHESSPTANTEQPIVIEEPELAPVE